MTACVDGIRCLYVSVMDSFRLLSSVILLITTSSSRLTRLSSGRTWLVVFTTLVSRSLLLLPAFASLLYVRFFFFFFSFLQRFAILLRFWLRFSPAATLQIYFSTRTTDSKAREASLAVEREGFDLVSVFFFKRRRVSGGPQNTAGDRLSGSVASRLDDSRHLVDVRI